MRLLTTYLTVGLLYLLSGTVRCSPDGPCLAPLEDVTLLRPSAAFMLDSAWCYRFSTSAGSVIGDRTANPSIVERSGGLPVVISDDPVTVSICIEDGFLGADAGAMDKCSANFSFRRFTTLYTETDNVPLARDTQTISLLRPEPASFSSRSKVIFSGCLTVGPKNIPQPRFSDLPFFRRDGEVLTLSDEVSSYGLSYVDNNIVDDCGGNYQFLRTYTIFDSCREASARLEQTVLVGDFTGPVLSGIPVTELVIPTNFGCNARFDLRLPGVTATDNCDDSTKIEVFIYTDGDLTTAPFGPFLISSESTDSVFSGLIPAGDHIYRLVASDRCDNQSVVDIPLRIVDRTPPVARCKTVADVVLAGGLSRVLEALELDDGSSDNCGLVNWEIPDDPIVLDCGERDSMTVLLRVTDGVGNTDSCRAGVKVLTDAPVVCTAPADVTLSCTEYRANLPIDLARRFEINPGFYAATVDSLFGMITVEEGCGPATIEQAFRGRIDGCGRGVLRRTFTSPSSALGEGSVCEQTITVVGENSYRIRLPGDDVGPCVRAQITKEDDFSVTSDGCDLFVLDQRKDTTRTEDFCYEIVTTYEVINFCEYTGLDEFTLVERPVSGDETMPLEIAVSDNAARVFDNSGTSDTTILTGYGQSPTRGAFRYLRRERYTDTNAPELSVLANDEGFAFTERCTGGLKLLVEATDDCVSPEFTLSVDFNTTDSLAYRAERLIGTDRVTALGEDRYEFDLRDIPIGRHLARLAVFDNCGNATVRFVPFRISDERTPQPNCRDRREVTLEVDSMGSAFGSIGIDSLLTGPAGTCSDIEVTYAIYTEAEFSATGFVADLDRPEAQLSCIDLGQTSIRVYASRDDLPGNNQCEVSLSVSTPDQMACSGQRGKIEGRITTFDGTPMGGIEVQAFGETGRRVLTDEDGQFIFQGLEQDIPQWVEPRFTSDYRNGLSTGDIFAISLFLAGKTEFTPQQLLAADVNASRAVTILDVYSIRDLILRKSDNFRDVYSWGFVPADFSLEGLTNGWTERVPGLAIVDFENGNEVVQDFMTYKTGDVTGDAVPTKQAALKMYWKETTDGSGLFAEALTDIGALQFELSGLSDHTQFQQLPAEAFRLENGEMRVSWLIDPSFDPNRPLLTVPVDESLPVLTGGKDRLRAEAYRFDMSTRTIELKTPTDEQLISKVSILPNPVSGPFSVHIDWPVAEAVTVTIYDAAGRQRAQQVVEMSTGSNQLDYRADQLDTGLYWLRVSNGTSSVVTKLLKR